MTRLDRKSDAQANAEALARRSATYADEHAASWNVRFDRRTEPPNLRSLVVDLRRAYQDEVPRTLHKHDVDGGGTPAYSGSFAAYLYGSPFQTDDDGTYQTPFRRCLASMHREGDGPTSQMARIVAGITVGGMNPEEAVEAEFGLTETWVCKAIAERALRVFWRRCSDVRLDLGRTVTAA